MFEEGLFPVSSTREDVLENIAFELDWTLNIWGKGTSKKKILNLLLAQALSLTHLPFRDVKLCASPETLYVLLELISH